MIHHLEQEKRLILETRNLSYVISLEHIAPAALYWGERIDARDAAALSFPLDRSSFEAEQWRNALEFPAFDGRTYTRCAICADRPLFLETQSVAVDGDRLTVTLADGDTGLTVALRYEVYPEDDIISRSAEVVCGARPLALRRFFSGSAPFPDSKRPLHAEYVSGCWAGEFRRQRQPLGEALLRLENAKGMSGPDSSPFLFLAESEEEDHGAAYAVLLGWSGSWAIEARRHTLGGGQITGGWNDVDFHADLKPGERLAAPPLFLCGADAGIGALSRKLHRFERRTLARPRRSRRILYNSWEATQFDVRCDEQLRLARRAAQLGVELFVVDDGWFGARSSDRAGLGDWQANPEKFPNGLEELIDGVHDLGMAFGLWMEPESVNPDSELYRRHPDWIYRLPGQTPLQLRNQYLLNLSLPAVRAFALDTLRGLLERYRIDYFKWDMNRSLGDCCERLTPLARETHVEAVYGILETLRREYPSLDIEACSGGGGRVDAGMMARTDQFWPSDNTDPFDRLLIQEGVSLAYAPAYTSCWVTDTPANARKAGRNDWTFKFHAAMMGTLGIGADISRFTEAEMDAATVHIGEYKAIRSLILEGDLYRLHLPSRENLSASLFVAPDRRECVLFMFLHSQIYGDRCARVRLASLDPEALYACEQTGERFYGKTLMSLGIVPDLSGDFDSRMLHFHAVTAHQ